MHSHLGYRTCYYRTFAVGSASRAQRDAYVRCREYMDQAIALVRPGATTADIVSLWPRAQEFGYPDETAAFALQYGHGVGMSIWEKPIFSRAGRSQDHGGRGRGRRRHGGRGAVIAASVGTEETAAAVRADGRHPRNRAGGA
jgi:hypothetical protein